MAQIDDNASQAHERLANLAGLGSDDIAKQYPIPGTYDKALGDAQTAYTNALALQVRANKPGQTKLSPGQSLVGPDGSVVTTAPPKAAGPTKLSPGQQLVGPDGTVYASAPGKPEKPTPPLRLAAGGSALMPDGSLITAPQSGQGQAAITKANAYAGYDDARKLALTQSFWAQVGPEWDAIEKAKTDGQLTQDQADQAHEDLTTRVLNENATGMNPKEQAAALRWPMEEGNVRSQDAASVLNNTVNAVSQGAKGMAPGQGALAAGAIGAILGAAPGFQASMGGSPLLTTQQKIQIGQGLLSGNSSAAAAQAALQMHRRNTQGSFDPNAGATPPAPPPTAPPPTGFSLASSVAPANPNVPAWGPNSPGAAAQPVAA